MNEGLNIFLAILLVLAGSTPLYEMMKSDVEDYLDNLQIEQPDFAARLRDVAESSLGTAYVGDPLGEGPQGSYDKDPIMDIAHVDCVTFVEQSIALAASDSYQKAQDFLQTLRYRNPTIAFENRNHFMVADWVHNNKFCEDITGKLDTPTQTVTRTIGRKHFFQLKELPTCAEQAVDPVLTLAYIPATEAATAEKNLPNATLLLFIGKVDWLFALHCGLYLHDAHGNGNLYHASSKAEKVVKNSLAAMFENNDRYLGFTAYSLSIPGT